MRYQLTKEGIPANPAGRTASPLEPNMRMLRAAGLASILGGHLYMEYAVEDLVELGKWLNGCAHVMHVWGWGEPGWGDWEFNSASSVFIDAYPCMQLAHLRNAAPGWAVKAFVDALGGDVDHDAQRRVEEFTMMLRSIVASLEELSFSPHTYIGDLISGLKFAVGDSKTASFMEG